MRAEIAQLDASDPAIHKRERWIFSLHTSPGGQATLYLDYYVSEFKAKGKRLWKATISWQRLMARDNTITSPPLPKDIANLAKTRLAGQILDLPITY